MKILFYSMEGVGHVTACVGLANELKKRQHEITFLIGQEYCQKFQKLGFNELILFDTEDESVELYQKQKQQQQQQNDENEKEYPVLPFIVERLKKSIVLQHKTPKEKLEQRNNEMFKRIYLKMKRLNHKIAEIINEYKPNLIIIDHFIIPPSISFNQLNIPWIYLFSGCPDFLYNSTELPPPMSGLPINDRSEWNEYRQLFHQQYQLPLQTLQNQLNNDFGFHSFDNEKIFLNRSPYLNIYGYPKELDFCNSEIVIKPKNFQQMDLFFDYNENILINNNNNEDEIPENFYKKSNNNEKLIYLTLGSCGTIDLQLMQKIIDTFKHQQKKYKLIISMGPLYKQLKIYKENMFGKKWLSNQLKILSKIDLIIFHGGNNTLLETLLMGKPMIIMPLFFDQYTNAQRIQEMYYGIRMDPYRFDSEELLQKIDQLLTNEKIMKNLMKISKRLKNSNSVQMTCKLLEDLVVNNEKI